MLSLHLTEYCLDYYSILNKIHLFEGKILYNCNILELYIKINVISSYLPNV